MPSSPSEKRLEDLMNRIRGDYESMPKAKFWRKLVESITERGLPLYCSTELAEFALAKDDWDTVGVIVQCLDRCQVHHPLIEELAVRRLVQGGQVGDALKRLDAALAMDSRPYLEALREKICP